MPSFHPRPLLSLLPVIIVHSHRLVDGSVFRVCVDAETCAIRQTEELIADEDPVYAVVARAQDSTVWCGTRRGGVFKFEA